jgi:ribosomal protection tetracycline resistance protein
MHRFRLEVPAEAAGPMMPVLARLRAQPDLPVTRGSVCLLTGEIPAARVHELEQVLPGLSRGEGVMEALFDRYRAVRGAVPVRARSDQNPLNRREYLLQVTRGVGGR